MKSNQIKSLRKRVRIRNYSGPHFSRIFPHSDWIRRDTEYLSVFNLNAGKCGENADQNNSKYGHFSGSEYLLVSLHNWMTRFEPGVTGPPRDAPERNWVLAGGIEIPFTYKVYGRINQKSYLYKKMKGAKLFFKIHCSFPDFIDIWTERRSKVCFSSILWFFNNTSWLKAHGPISGGLKAGLILH